MSTEELVYQHLLYFNTSRLKYTHRDWSPYVSIIRISWENLIKDQGIFPLMIIFLILKTLSLDILWILLGENWCWSLLGLKGLICSGGSMGLIFRPNWGLKSRKKIVFESGTSPRLSQGLDDCPNPPPPPLIWRSGSATDMYCSMVALSVCRNKYSIVRV